MQLALWERLRQMWRRTLEALQKICGGPALVGMAACSIVWRQLFFPPGFLIVARHTCLICITRFPLKLTCVSM